MQALFKRLCLSENSRDQNGWNGLLPKLFFQNIAPLAVQNGWTGDIKAREAVLEGWDWGTKAPSALVVEVEMVELVGKILLR